MGSRYKVGTFGLVRWLWPASVADTVVALYFSSMLAFGIRVWWGIMMDDKLILRLPRRNSPLRFCIDYFTSSLLDLPRLYRGSAMHEQATLLRAGGQRNHALLPLATIYLRSLCHASRISTHALRLPRAVIGSMLCISCLFEACVAHITLLVRISGNPVVLLIANFRRSPEKTG